MDTKWYEKTVRWGQTNLTETDPVECDVAWWKRYWENAGIQGIIVNAGGIVAYYPSKHDLQYKAEMLAQRDLFGEFVKEARSMGLKVLARMDINRTAPDFYDRHPGWFSCDISGMPYTVQDRYYTCINGEYYKSYIPSILEEIIDSYHPDGFVDNSWTGLPRKFICYCENCRKSFKDSTGYDLPEKPDYADPIYRKWIMWNYTCRTENWVLFNRVTRKSGGEDCIWLGMVTADFVGTQTSFCDLWEIGKRSRVIMADQQGRDEINGFEQNSLNGWLLHQISGWKAVIPESMANYVKRKQAFRKSANPPLETQLWMAEGIAGGISPWYHFIGAKQEDGRIFETCLPILQWHKKNEKYLYDREPVANIGIVWSQGNVDFYGRNKAQERVGLALRGVARALTSAGMPFLPVNINDIEACSDRLDVLILPEIAVISDEQCEMLRKFHRKGKAIVIIGDIAQMDETGADRKEFPLADVTGFDLCETGIDDEEATFDWDDSRFHNYIRIEDGVHPVFTGFEATGIIAMGGKCKKLAVSPEARVLATYIPEFPIYPPEFSWMRVKHTDIPMVVSHQRDHCGKVIYFAWNLDCLYGKLGLPDHGALISNAVKWAVCGKELIRVECDAYIDFKAYRQDSRMIIHLVNVNHTGMEPGYAEKVLPVGPVKIMLNVNTGYFTGVKTDDENSDCNLKREGQKYVITLEKLNMQELIVLE